MKKITAILLLPAFLFTQLEAWSAKGHAIVAGVAWARLNSTTKSNIKLLLGDQPLQSVASWADEIRKDRDETYDWHFVDIPKSADGFLESRDCFRPQDNHKNAQTDHHNCIVDRIEMFRQVLIDQNASRQERVEALKFLVHFVGDIHQPLHCVDEARGGNDIKVAVFGSDQCGNYPCNLHGVWDYSLIEHTGYPEGYARHLNHLIRHRHLEAKAGGNPEDWANESHTAAGQVLDQHVSSIDQAYWQANIGLVDERLALASVRLAALLNDSLGKIPTKELKKSLKAHTP